MYIKKGAVITAGILLAVGILVSTSTTIIGQGHGGVVYNRSHGVEDTPIGQGWHLVNPFERITEYQVSTETVTGAKFSVQTKDGKPLTVQVSYDYNNDFNKLPFIYNKFKGQKSDVIEEGWMQTRLKKATLGVFSKYSVLEVFQNQGEINAQIEKEFRDAVEKTGFMVDSVTLGAPTPDAKTAEAIQRVVDAQQLLEQLEIEKEQATKLAEKARIEAQGIADSQTIKAKGESDANAIIKKSITPELIDYKLNAKWDGKLPQVTGGSTPMISIPTTK